MDFSPLPTVSPSSSTPLPSISTACGTSEGLSMVIVTLPAFAVSSFLSNLSAPPGSAAMVRFSPPPEEPEELSPPPEEPEELSPPPEEPEELEELLDEPLSLADSSSSPPQPANASTAIAAIRVSLRMDLLSSEQSPGEDVRRGAVSVFGDDSDAVVFPNPRRGGEADRDLAVRVGSERARAGGPVLALAEHLVDLHRARLEPARPQLHAG